MWIILSETVFLNPITNNFQSFPTPQTVCSSFNIKHSIILISFLFPNATRSFQEVLVLKQSKEQLQWHALDSKIPLLPFTVCCCWRTVHVKEKKDCPILPAVNTAVLWALSMQTEKSLIITSTLFPQRKMVQLPLISQGTFDQCWVYMTHWN